MITEIMKKADELIVSNLRNELQNQGHHLTGKLEESICGEASEEGLKGFALDYQKFVNMGFPASSASFKQFPFVVKYWQQRGLDLKEAKQAAAATIKKWMEEGMPTDSSMAYSSNGRRKGFIGAVNAAIGDDVKILVKSELDKMVQTKFHELKSVTI